VPKDGKLRAEIIRLHHDTPIGEHGGYEGDQSRALQEISQINYAIKYVTTHLQEIPQRIR